jgi:small subunit ribosomal protein S1
MTTQKTANKNIGFTHEDFAALLDKYDYHFSPGDVVAGTVFSMEPRERSSISVLKPPLLSPCRRCRSTAVDNPEEVLQPNETCRFFILTDENEDGQLTLSNPSH